MTEDEEVIEYLAEGLGLGRDMIDTQLTRLLGENPDRWFGAGMFASWVMDSMRDNSSDDDVPEEHAQRMVLLVAVLLRSIVDHPLALAALHRYEAEAKR